MGAPEEDDDETYRRIARAETAERVDRMLRALREDDADARWDEVYRQAHTLSGIARDVDPALGEMAREVLSRLRTANGARVRPTPQDEAALRAQLERIGARVDAAARRDQR